MVFTLVYHEVFFHSHCSARRSDPNSTSVLSDATTDSQKTLAEWLQLPKESLVLRCSNLHLVSRGSVNILANHLLIYYHPPAALSTAALPSSQNVTVPTIVPLVISIGDTGTISDIVRQELCAIFLSEDFTDMLPFMPTTTPTALDSPTVDLTYNGRPELRSPYIQTPLVFSSSQPATTLHHLLPNQQQPTSSRLPALPSTVLKKIQAGEFMTYYHILCLPLLLSILLSSFLSHLLLTQPPYLRCPVLNHLGLKFMIFHLGYKLGIIFLRATIYYNPMLTNELLLYQSMMCQHGTRYIFEDFVDCFDHKFKI